MNNEMFNKVTEERIKKCIDVMCKKSDEYSTDSDKLHNFKIAGALQGCSDIKALGGMMCKHTVSIYDLINDFENALGAVTYTSLYLISARNVIL